MVRIDENFLTVVASSHRYILVPKKFLVLEEFSPHKMRRRLYQSFLSPTLTIWTRESIRLINRFYGKPCFCTWCIIFRCDNSNSFLYSFLNSKFMKNSKWKILILGLWLKIEVFIGLIFCQNLVRARSQVNHVRKGSKFLNPTVCFWSLKIAKTWHFRYFK